MKTDQPEPKAPAAAHCPPSPPPRFRYEVTAADPDEVRHMAESTGFFHPGEVQIAVELVEERLAKGAASGYHFVFLERAGQVEGYACYGPIPGTSGSFDLYWIVVRKACQGRGVGRRLLKEVEHQVRRLGARRVYAETSGRPQYAPTRAFYEHLGFRAEAVLKDFYAPGDDKVIYVKIVGC